jgi:hypothetical protein
MKILEQDPPLAQECKTPWILRAFLYPLSAAGITHILVFTFCPVLLILLEIHVFRYSCLSSLMFFAGIILLVGYGIYFVTYCVFDSSKGHRNAPYIPKRHFPDKWELVRQYFLLLVSVAMCFGPLGVYYGNFRQIDLIFWLLIGIGLFFFPMTLLSVLLFDSFTAVNPIFVMTSIFKNIIGYCSLFLFFCTIIAFMIFALPTPSLLGFTGHAIRFYLLLVLANRLGWFYWWHKDKLGWGI